MYNTSYKGIILRKHIFLIFGIPFIFQLDNMGLPTRIKEEKALNRPCRKKMVSNSKTNLLKSFLSTNLGHVPV